MPKLPHNCGIWNEEVHEKDFKMCFCEYCLSFWFHAQCVFPNASEAKLKVLNGFNSCYTVKCADCKLKRKPEIHASMFDLNKNLNKLTQSFEYFQQQNDKYQLKLQKM